MDISIVVSYNGKAFKAANRMIESLLENVATNKYFRDIQIKWHFNVERAPWWGGTFERLIRSMRNVSNRSLDVLHCLMMSCSLSLQKSK